MVPALDLFWCASRWALLWFCSRCGLRLAATILRAEAPVAHCLCWPFAGFFHCVSQAGSQLKNAHMAYTHNTHVAPCWTGCVFLQVVGCFGYTRLIYGIFSSIYNGAQQANVMSLVFRVARSTHIQRYQYLFVCARTQQNDICRMYQRAYRWTISEIACSHRLSRASRPPYMCSLLRFLT